MQRLISLLFRGLGAEARAVFNALRSLWLGMLLTLLAALLLIASQLPQQYTIEVGREEGYNSDLPLLEGFYTAEPEDKQALPNYRWTTGDATVNLPGFGQRPLLVAMRILSINSELVEKGAKSYDIWSGQRLIATLPVVGPGETISFLLPASNAPHQLSIRIKATAPSGDSRELGLPIDQITIHAPSGPAAPEPAPMILWLLAATLAWVAVRCCGFAPPVSFVLLAPWALLAGIAAFLDPPRAAYGAWPAIVALAWGLVLVLVLRFGAPSLARRLAIPLEKNTLGWLLLLALVAFVLRYGGKIYPDAMWGDIGFHTNRFLEVSGGRVLLLSRNRGVDFPYPPALYLLLAPCTLFGIAIPDLLRFAGAVLDACSPFLAYTVGVLALGGVSQRRAGAPTNEPTQQHWAVGVAALYSLSAATFMTTWWNFSTHIFAQFAHLLLITALVLLVPRMLVSGGNAMRWLRTGVAALVVCFSLVFLGHFGFWINMSLLGGFGLVALGFAATRGHVTWRAFWALTTAFVAAEAIAIGMFYSSYSGLFLEQARATSEGGLTGMANRGAVPREQLWRALWDYGFRVHFGFFPIPLALLGASWWWTKQPAPPSIDQTRTWLLRVLISGTLLTAVCFAALPFISGSSLSTRWLMFSAWAIALTTISTVRATWHWGWPIRLAYSAMACYVLWVTANQWLGALAFRIRPPEPF